MKSLKLILLASSLILTSYAIEPSSPAPVTPATIVNVPTFASELANGYASAIQQMSLKGLVIYYKNDKDVVAIRGMRTVRALSGVLVITFSAGDTMAISAGKVVMITDGARTP